jgi:hypothetical protein
MTTMVSLASRKEYTTAKEVSDRLCCELRLIDLCLENIGGSYFMKVSPEKLWEKHFGALDFTLEQRGPHGNDSKGSMFADSLGA